MDMTGEYRIPASRQKVWEGLNDPEILKQAIEGCQKLEKVDDEHFDATVRAKVGPVSTTFNGKVTLSDINPPSSYKITGQGQGGAAGFAKGGADVHLREDGPESTILSYTAHADVGGKLAQLGGRLVQGTAKSQADKFFSKFGEIVGGRPAEKLEPTATIAEEDKGEAAQASAPSTAGPAVTAPAAESAATGAPAAYATPEHGSSSAGSRAAEAQGANEDLRGRETAGVTQNRVDKVADAAVGQAPSSSARPAPSAQPAPTSFNEPATTGGGMFGLPPWATYAAIAVVVLLLLILIF